MDFQTISAIVFVALMAIAVFLTRKKLVLQKIIHPILYIILYRTQAGIKAMDRVAKKFPTFLKYFSYFGVFIGFVGMIFITFSLFQNLYNVFMVPEAASGVGIVQPFAKNIPGTFFVPFFYFIISIFVLVIIHEFSHGVMARRWGLKIKSSGLAIFGILLPILPAAFVEPDEKQLVKKPRMQQLSILAAGPFSNIVTAFIVILILLFAVNPVIDNVVEFDGVSITGFIDDMPAEASGMQIGEKIISIDDNEMLSVKNFTDYLSNKTPNEEINVKTNASSYPITLGMNPNNEEKAYLGVFVEQHTTVSPEFENKYGKITADIIMWFIGLLIWLYLLNLGIGLFNLVPLPITDGGRMMLLALQKYFKEKTAMKIWKFLSVVFILLIVLNILLGIIK